MGVLNFSTNEQKDLVLKIAQMDLPTYAHIFKNPEMPEHISLRETNLNRLGVKPEQLEDFHETVCKWREVYQNALYEARKRIDSGLPSSGSQPAQASLPWQERFRTLDQLETGPMKMLIEGFAPWGVNGIGSLSGVAKTWFGLSIAKALTSGKPFLSVYPVTQTQNVLYLIPEMGDRTFRNRAEKMGLPMKATSAPWFRCTTVKDGRIALRDSGLLECIKETKPVIFLDTLVRFNPTDDENSAQQNAKLIANVLFDYQTLGSPGQFFMHHSPKYASDAESMTLENVFRGTGDLGAMCDAAYGLCNDKRKRDNGKEWDAEYFDESKRLTRVLVKCVKPRDFEGPEAFLVQGRPYIDERGDFAVIDGVERRPLEERIVAEIQKNVGITVGALRKQFGTRDDRIKKIAKAAGYEWDGKYWRVALPSLVTADLKKDAF